MKEVTAGKLIGAWVLLSVVLGIAGSFWLWRDLVPGYGAAAIAKLAILLALSGVGGVVFLHLLGHSWSSRIEDLKRFVEAPFAARVNLPEDGPQELQDFSRAMRARAERIQQVVERANLEASRRQTILAAMAEGVLAVDENLKVVFCNDAFAQAFGTRMPVAEGRAFYEIVREPVLRDILERVVRTGSAQKDQFQLPSAAGRWFEVRALPLGDASKRGAVVVLHDITDIKRQEQVRKDFVADVSHELRTPLAAIRGYAETLLDGGLDDRENGRKFLEIILAHTTRLSNIASDLLVLSELDSKMPLAPADHISVLDILNSAIHTVEGGAALSHVRLKLGVCEDCKVLGYRFRLEQALVNLLDNAVKFNRPDGEVRIECGRTDDRQVRISVSDTGIGIPSEDLKRIFERFYRVDKARSRPTGGTGLGLSIVKEVVSQMGGSVQVESQLGHGSRFTIFLQAV